jgi:hypothetical protein
MVREGGNLGTVSTVMVPVYDNGIVLDACGRYGYGTKV